MGNGSDSSKYLEGNYSDNPFKAVKEWWEDEQQARELMDEEEYIKACMQYAKSKREEHHYLVDGSVLTCTRCTMEPDTPIDKEFTAPEGSNEVLLKVTKNQRYHNGAGQYFATVDDSKKFDNIEPFGNCKNTPDREEEKQALIMAGESEELRKLGTCRYLMKLNDKWENMISDVGYMEIAELDEAGVEGITMESILFCRHGGLIYPKASGYISTDDVVVEELEEEAEEEQILVEPDQSDPQAVKEYMWYFFRNKGLSMEAVAGILGNVQEECSFDLEQAKERNPYRFGLFQWSNNDGDARRNALNKWLDENGMDINLISTQCEYAYIEMQNGGMLSIILDVNENNPVEIMCNYTALENAEKPEEAAKIFATSFERCCVGYYIDKDSGKMHYNDIQASYERQDNAITIYNEMKKMEAGN